MDFPVRELLIWTAPLSESTARRAESKPFGSDCSGLPHGQHTTGRNGGRLGAMTEMGGDHCGDCFLGANSIIIKRMFHPMPDRALGVEGMFVA